MEYASIAVTVVGLIVGALIMWLAISSIGQD
jgi:uncharacterized membrane-anchored protein YhcB (DUF1043 family)